MRVKETRRLQPNPQVVRRRRSCSTCGTSYQTDERPRLWVGRGGEREPFLRGVLLASLRRAADGCDPPILDKHLSEAVRRVVVGMLADGLLEPTADQVRARAGCTLLEQKLETVACRYDPSLNPFSFRVRKRGGRPDEPFARDKLKQSITAASASFLDAAQIEAVVEDVESKLGATSTPADTDQIRGMVHESLRIHDERVYLLYTVGGSPGDTTITQILDRVAPLAQVVKRDGAVVLFSAEKLFRSINLSFMANHRDSRDHDISAFVADEERRARDKMTIEHKPEPTASICGRVLEWLFDIDELAWATYWMAFASDYRPGQDASPVQQLAAAQIEMLSERRESSSM
jgi:transcriptional regulator NrdR family protein